MKSPISIIASLLIIGVAQKQVKSDTIAVSGVVRNADGSHSDDVRVALGYAPGGGNAATSDQSGPAGIFTLVRGNAFGIVKVHIVALGDADYSDTPVEVLLRPIPGGVLLGKAGAIVRMKKPSATVSLPCFSEAEAKQRLKSLEEAQAALVIGGHRSQEDAQEIFARQSAQILANVANPTVEPRELLMEAKGMVDKEISARHIISDEVRMGIPESDEYLKLERNRFRLESLREPGSTIPDDVVEAIRDLSARDIPTDWLPANVAKSTLERRLRGLSGDSQIGAFLIDGQAGSAVPRGPLLNAENGNVSNEAIADWVENSDDARKAVLIEALREHQGVSERMRQALEKATDVPRISVVKIEK